MGPRLDLGLDWDPHLVLHLELDSDLHLDLHLEHASFAKDGGGMSDPRSPLFKHPTGAHSTLTPRGAHHPRVLPAVPGGLGSPGGKPGAAAAVAGALASSEPRGGTKWQRSRWPWLLLSGASGAERAPRRS